MINYTIPILMGVAVLFIYPSIYILIEAVKDEDVSLVIVGAVWAFIPSALFVIIIMKIILWVRGL